MTDCQTLNRYIVKPELGWHDEDCTRFVDAASVAEAAEYYALDVLAGTTWINGSTVRSAGALRIALLPAIGSQPGVIPDAELIDEVIDLQDIPAWVASPEADLCP